MWKDLNDIVKNIKINIADRNTTIKGVLFVVVGVSLLIVPTLPYTFKLSADQYAEFLSYTKIVGSVLCVLGLILIGAIKTNKNEKEN